MTLAVALLLASFPPLQPTASIAGCIVDAAHKPLPGVTVAATGESVRGTTESNTQGCYNLKGIPPGKYRVTARLTGFTNVTRDNVNVTVDAAASLDLAMLVSSPCDCVHVERTVAQRIAAADAVVHVRITGPQGGQPEGAPYYQHAALVLHTIKGPAELPKTIPVQQDQTSGNPPPWDADYEMVAFLEAAQGGAFRIAKIDGSRTLAFTVRDGQITTAPTEFSKYVGTTLDSFLYELRTASR